MWNAKERNMSDSVNNLNGGNTPNPTQPVQGGKEVSSAPQVDMSKVSGAEAAELVRESKATGKSIEEVYAARQGIKPSGGSNAPKEQSTQSALKEAVAEAKRKLKIKEGDKEIEVDEDEVLNVYKSRKEHQRAAHIVTGKQIGRAHV